MSKEGVANQNTTDREGQAPLYFLWPTSKVEQELNTSATDGLPTSAIKALQERDGPNALAGGGGVSALGILAGQIFNAMVLVLILAFAVSLGIQSWIEGGVIAGVIIINIVVGFYQEYGSAKTMDSLRSLSSPTAHVIRSGNTAVIPSREVVVGDLVELKTGDVVPADLRLVDAMNFETDEALLTGESLPIQKDPNAEYKEASKPDFDPRDIGVGDRINMAYTSSTVTKGRARGIAVAIGMDTEIGAIAKSLGGSDTKVRKVRRNDEGHAPFHRYVSAYALTVWDNIGSFLGVNKGTPLQKTLSKLAILLFFVAVVFALIVFGANGFNTSREISLYAVATGLSMIPASLVVVLTVTLAGGTSAMAARHVIVRKLDSLEALGAVTDICSDKTGTLTQGRMVVRAAYLPSEGTIYVGENNDPFNPTIGELTFSSLSPQEDAQAIAKKGEQPRTPLASITPDDYKQKGDNVTNFLNIATMCNLASVVNKGEEGWIARGDPTECAIQVFAHRFGWGRPVWTEGDQPKWTEITEFPFDSDVKRMSVIYSRNSDEKRFAFMKGAVERMLDACSGVQTAEGIKPIDKEMEAKLFENVEALAEQGLRVLALASRAWTGADQPERADVERDMTLMGLVGLYDPPRPETQGAVHECHQAGIQVHMLTGDHVATARAIALQVGILPRNLHAFSKEVIDSMVFTAAQFDKLSDEEVDALPLLPLVVARCAPHTKVRMVDALHRRKLFCAMTGDGVNDAPSLKRADIGIGMGTGSDVAKDASDLVLTNDQFDSILNAVQEGRRIADNIQRFVLHLLAQNVIQALVLLIGLAFKDVNGLSVFPLAPVEILYIIMVTSGFPAIGLGGQEAAADVMRRKPRNPKHSIFTWELIIDLAAYGIVGGALCLATFTLVVFGFNDGNLGIDSNNTQGQGSDNVFRARSATFALLTWISLLLAFEVIDFRRSFFRRVPKTDYPYTQWARDIWANQFLFWSCTLGFFSVFPMIYIPGLNTVVMKHSGISWEWAIAFIGTLIFFAFSEFYKLAKRAYFRRQRGAGVSEEDEAVLPIFKEWRTMSFSKTATQNV